MSALCVAVSGLSVVGTLAPGLPVLQCLRRDDAGSLLCVADRGGASTTATPARGKPTEPSALRDTAANASARGLRIVGLSYDPLDPASYDAQLLDASYLLPYPGQGASALLARLRYIHARERLDVILPTLDSELAHYIQLLPELRKLGIRLLLPSAAAFSRRSKMDLEAVSALSSVKVPRSIAVKSLAEAYQKSQKLRLPFVVKGNLHGATVVHSLDHMAAAVSDHAGRWGYPVVLQEYIPGTEFDVAALADEAWQLVGVVPMKKLQLDDRGKAWGALTVDDPDLIRAAQRVVSGLCWSGPLELELMRHRDSGELYLIEINPRFPAWIHLAAAAGQNLPWASVRLAMGEPVAPFDSYRAGILQLRRSIDLPCELSIYESMVQRGEAVLRPRDGQPASAAIDPALQPQNVLLAPIFDGLLRGTGAPGSLQPHRERDPQSGSPLQDLPQPDDLHPLSLAGGHLATRLPYQAPQITRHHMAVGNRLPSDGAQHRYLDAIDGVPVPDLVAAHGSPLFVFSERRLRSRARAFRQAFASRYPRTRFGWSYKTNYLDAICGVLHQEGWDAEVVSDLEYAMARRLGVPGSRIVCNGAYKSRAWLSQAIADGALIQVDHFDELNEIEDLVRERKGAPLSIGLRVNMQVPALSGAAWERFGFSLDSGEVLDAILRIAVNDRLRLSGLHCHLGTFVHEPKAYREATARLCELFLAAESLCGYRLSCINLGGGFPSSNVLTGSLNESDDEAGGPDITAFASAICDELSESLGDRLEGPLEDWPVLMLESGRHLVDDSGSLIATVVGRRTQPSTSSVGNSSLGSRGLVLDAGLNVLYTAHWYRHRVLPAQPVPGPIEETSLFGPLCMNIDTLRVGLPLPPLVPGHRVVIQPVGAYNVTQWMQFSQLRPAVVMIDSEGRVELLRRGETLDDVKGQEPAVNSRYRAT